MNRDRSRWFDTISISCQLGGRQGQDVGLYRRPGMELTEFIENAPWREAVTYRDTWPHE